MKSKIIKIESLDVSDLIENKWICKLQISVTIILVLTCLDNQTEKLQMLKDNNNITCISAKLTSSG